MNPPGIDIVAVNYKTPSDLQNFCASLAEHSPARDYSLTIVNVCPDPADTTAASRYDLATVLPIDANVGYGQAANVGGVGNREIVGIFNVDIAFTPDSIDRCCDVLFGHEEWAAVGPRQTNANGQLTAGGIFGPVGRPSHRAWLEADRGQASAVQSCTMVAGSAMFIRRSAWDALTACPIYQRSAPRPCPVGPLLETPLFYEDTWFSRHAMGHGWGLGFVGDALIRHWWHGSVNANGGESHFEASHELFRAACDAHGLDHD